MAIPEHVLMLIAEFLFSLPFDESVILTNPERKLLDTHPDIDSQKS